MIALVLAAAISWPLRYNDGVTAYRSNDFSTAAATFEQATASPNRALQERAQYNLGNTAYRLGEADLTKAQALWERAIKSYETALVGRRFVASIRRACSGRTTSSSASVDARRAGPGRCCRCRLGLPAQRPACGS